MEILLFQLYGPMASWGAAAVGESRPTSDHPGRSALLGLLAAALGIERSDAARQQALSDAVRFAVRQLSPGRLIRDFHTIQVPKRDRKARYATRKNELGGTRDRLNTIISRREYRCDGLWYVATTLAEKSDWALEDLRHALECPVFMPYLGRKSCPLAAPMRPRIIQARSVKDALTSDIPAIHEHQQRWLRLDGTVDYFWEGDDHDLVPQDTRYPEDEPVSRPRWQFRGRLEHHARVKEAL